MRMRFIKPGERKRFMVRGPVSKDTMDMWGFITSMGYEPVGLMRFILHIIFPLKDKQDDDGTMA